MKLNLLTILFVLFLLLAGKSTVYAGNVPPTAPAWDNNNGPYIVFSNTEIGLYWTPSTSSVGLAGYYIYRCMGTNCNFPTQPLFNVNDANASLYADGTVSAATTYSYAIAAYDTAGDISALTPVMTVTTSGNVSNIVPVINVAQPVKGVGSTAINFIFNMTSSYLRSGAMVYGNSSYNWSWNFGDGTTVNGESSVSHVYPNPGTYTIRLTIFDAGTGDSAFVEQAVTVVPATVSGLVLRLRFNGDINDYSGNQLETQGGGAGMPAFGPGEGGHGIYLDGSRGGAYVDVKDDSLLDGLSALTLSLYAMKNVANASGTIYVKQGQYSIMLGSQGVTATLTNSSGNTVTLSAPSVFNNDTNWHHYAVTYNGAAATLYFDGAVVASQSFSGSIANNPGADLLLGETPSGNTFNGSLDWVRLYNQALTAAQIQYLYNGTPYGDVNSDGNVTIYDAFLTAQSGVGSITLTSGQQTQAEVGNTNIMSYNAFLIAQKSINLILKFPEDVNEE